ncbi:MAG: hypothetical protein BWY43_00399 [candidate division WS2 bacterium ADurb.Bin280]|uniref:Uncharacterized protein n=1 Tax=candidate division WS2 bacterium ADurb.Bin280 TaxID=1852829 RepID=A0A1V5SEK1_9BACT|nr:MAG: hypothetical protein BWY43_00399 [candidate division WS2 bacterium ADurb.Bin280]
MEYPRFKKFDKGWIENGINSVFIVKNNTPFGKIKIQNDELSEAKWMNLNNYMQEIRNNNPHYRKYPEEFVKLFEFI